MDIKYPDQCGNCTEPFDYIKRLQPLVLPCGHSICERCLDACQIPSDDIICKDCRREYVEGDKDCNPINKSLLNMIKPEATIDVKLQRHKRELLNRSSEIKNYLPVWIDQYCEGIKMFATLRFWCDELDNIEKLVKTATKSENVPKTKGKSGKQQKTPEKAEKSVKKASKSENLAKTTKKSEKQLKTPEKSENKDHCIEEIRNILVKMENTREYCGTRWKFIKDACQNIKATKKILSITRVSVLKVLLNIKEDVYLTRFCAYNKYYCKLTAGLDCIHVHSGIPSAEFGELVSTAKIIETTWTPTIPFHANKVTRAFLEISFKQSNGEDLKQTIYIRFDEKTKTNFQKEMFKFLIGMSGKTFKGAKIRKFEKQFQVSIQESFSEKMVMDTPNSLVLDREQYNSIKVQSNCLVLGKIEDCGVNLCIFLNDRDHLVTDCWYFGRVESGMSFIRLMSTNDGRLLDCGVVLDDLNF